jgi:hypothetical protein
LIRLYDLRRGEEVLALPVYRHVISSLAFSHDGRLLVSGGSDRTVRLWEVTTGQEVFALDGHQPPIAAVAFSPDGRLVASGSGTDRSQAASPEPDSIRLWDVVTGEEVRRLPGRGSAVTSLAFAPGGSRLASGLRNSTVLLWEVPPSLLSQRREGARPSADELEALWVDLAGEDARTAHRAGWTMAGESLRAVAFLNRRLQPVPEPDRERTQRLIADLDSEKFAARQQAVQHLGQLGEPVVPLLKEALAKQPSAEAKRHLEELLDRAEALPTSGEALRALRAVGVLERIGTAAARQVLQRLAGGVPTVRLTREAKAALDRLERQAARR